MGDAESDLFQSCDNFVFGKTIIHLGYSFQHYLQIIKELEDENAELYHHKLPNSHKSTVYIYCSSSNRYKILNLQKLLKPGVLGIWRKWLNILYVYVSILKCKDVFSFLPIALSQVGKFLVIFFIVVCYNTDR